MISCFAGTRILAAAGKIPVKLFSGRRLPPNTIGSSTLYRLVGNWNVNPFCRHPSLADTWPVRVTAGAFGNSLPARDLLLSPDHAVFVDGALVPVRHLINGGTTVQEPADEVTYYHVELATHDVILAEELPRESYLDTGNHAAFVTDENVAWRSTR